MVPEKYMTVADASRVLGISESTTRRYINKGLIPAIRIYGKFLIDALNLNKAIDEYSITAKEAAEICEELYKNDFQNNANKKKRGENSGGTCKDFGTSKTEKPFLKRSEAAAELNLTIDTIRNWEMNGLLKVKRKKNGYRIYDADDINRLKIIRSLRCANYSLSAILRMLNALEYRINKNQKDILKALNTPEENEDIVSVCDRLVFSLEKAEENAREVINILNEIKALE